MGLRVSGSMRVMLESADKVEYWGGVDDIWGGTSRNKEGEARDDKLRAGGNGG